ncbi:MAG: LPS export ABC transporter periplasmic protein LptC [Sphingomonas sp.]|uniref:LPS export ABC transporter periplasmic protein LptC n=1 Tax=Sphingomonas sp. TaxID=28214 RepID=UPI001ACE2669|nr:LPS export ABC transporter periplasmic protein LptC [Sphingomonas sp.]MBN8815768.1 LPS export ABC transporter periplasmic protein LptC [Sphingomonas sp.]
MSDIAAKMRSERQHWAAPGSGHDHLVAVLRIVLPSAVGVVAALMVFLPLTSGGDVSFVLDRNKVEVSKERLKVQSATYRGQDNKGQPFVLTAENAVQKSAAEPMINMQKLMAELQMPDGLAKLVAPTGNFNPTTQQMDLAGPITFAGPNNYTLQSNGATVDLKTKTMEGKGGVSGTVPQGTFTADTMSADLDGRVVRLDGRARLRIAPRQAK